MKTNLTLRSNARSNFFGLFVLFFSFSFFAAPSILAQTPAPPKVAGANRKADLVELTDLDNTIKLDIRYATANNFVGRAVYSEPRAFLQKPAAEAVLRVHRNLKKQNLGVIIYDGYRPWSVTKLFWDVTSGNDRNFVADPAKGSKHNRGAAIDLGLYDLRTGEIVAMPSGYDEFSERAFPNYSGGTATARRNRDLLRREMEAQGFAVNKNEWWHFDYKNWEDYQIYDIPFSAVRDLDADFKSAAVEEKPEWKRYFEAANVSGGIAVYDLRRNKFQVYDRARLDKDFVPASTSKIIHSLVFLETGALKNAEEVLKWDGVNRSIAAWNQDHDLRSAFKNSAVWFYVESSKRVGQEKMQHYYNLADYGNRSTNGFGTDYWNTGDLRVTMRGQIQFLKRLHENRLPFSAGSINAVKEIAIQEKTDKYVLRAKTGWSTAFEPNVGWYVGYVARGADAYFFAVEIDIKNPEDAAKRAEIARNVLRELKIIE